VQIILDTNVISAVMRGKENDDAHKWYSAQIFANLYLTSITLAELAQGIWRLGETHMRRSQYMNELERLENEFAGQILDFDRHAARLWGKLRGSQLRRGRVLPDLDVQIAAIALHHDMAVATGNVKHFRGLGIEVIEPFVQT
jgi:predicted nucleic acid-binding protein